MDDVCSSLAKKYFRLKEVIESANKIISSIKKLIEVYGYNDSSYLQNALEGLEDFIEARRGEMDNIFVELVEEKCIDVDKVIKQVIR